VAETPKFDSRYAGRLILTCVMFVIYVITLFIMPRFRYLIVYLGGILLIDVLYHIELGFGRVQDTYSLFYENLLLAAAGVMLLFADADWVYVLVNIFLSALLVFEMIRVYQGFKDQWMLDTTKHGPRDEAPVLKPFRKAWFGAHTESFLRLSFALLIGVYLMGVFGLPIPGVEVEYIIPPADWAFIGAMNLILAAGYALWRTKSKIIFLMIGLQFIVAGFQYWVLLLVMIASILVQLVAIWISIMIYSPMRDTGLFQGQAVSPR
jgi:hypothetical protein